MAPAVRQAHHAGHHFIAQFHRDDALRSRGADACAVAVSEAAARGIAADRLVFAPTMHQTAHLNRIGCADLFIDTWPCNAHTTASDALWAGLPLVTLSGESFASRVAGSLLQAIGVPDTVCDTVQAYESKVIELATNDALRLSIRTRVQAARQTAALFSGALIAPQIESLYERMWERALAGLPPEHLAANH